MGNFLVTPYILFVEVKKNYYWLTHILSSQTNKVTESSSSYMEDKAKSPKLKQNITGSNIFTCERV